MVTYCLCAFSYLVACGIDRYLSRGLLRDAGTAYLVPAAFLAFALAWRAPSAPACLLASALGIGMMVAVRISDRDCERYSRKQQAEFDRIKAEFDRI